MVVLITPEAHGALALEDIELQRRILRPQYCSICGAEWAPAASRAAAIRINSELDARRPLYLDELAETVYLECCEYRLSWPARRLDDTELVGP